MGLLRDRGDEPAGEPLLMREKLLASTTTSGLGTRMVNGPTRSTARRRASALSETWFGVRDGAAATELCNAQDLLDSGAITAAEYDSIKTKALASA